MVKSRGELFAERFVRRKLERRAKEWIKAFTSGLSVEDLRYAAENNLNIISTLLKPGEQRSRQKKANPLRHLLEGVTVDDLIRLFHEVAPQHAAVLREYRVWFTTQCEIGRKDVLG